MSTRGSDDANRLPGDPSVLSHRPRPSIAPCPYCDTESVLGEPCPGCGEITVDTRLNTVLLGKYRIEALIGSGGMGRVYRAEHLQLSEFVAVKFLVGQFAARGEIRVRFKREATVLARLRHPGIVTVIDFGEDQGELFLVMELLQGHTLDKLFSPTDGMPYERAIALIDGVLEVLEEAHAAGVVHRDLKPENVMKIEPSGRLKVLDFGIASVQSDERVGLKLTTEGSVRGTPHYMSPEQCTGRTIGPPTDVYAVGAMLYEMLVGHTPFGGKSAPEIMAQQMYAPVPSLFEGGATREIPISVEAIIRRAMSKRPEERPTVSELRAALARISHGVDPRVETTRNASQRAQAASLSREDRALTEKTTAPPTGPLMKEMTGRLTAVALWGFSTERANALRLVLSTQGVEVAVHTGEEPPGYYVGTSLWKALILPADPSTESRLRAIRQSPNVGTLPLIVIDLHTPSESAGLIRAGASDVALDKVDDVAVCQKVLRALRRGR